MEVLDKYGPVAIAIDASDPLFVSYSSSIYGYVPGRCNSNRIGIALNIIIIVYCIY
jgi:hypothetical protein